MEKDGRKSEIGKAKVWYTKKKRGELSYALSYYTALFGRLCQWSDAVGTRLVPPPHDLHYG